MEDLDNYDLPAEIENVDQQHLEYIARIKELRQQKRKLGGNDYVPFDESTSGGIFAKD